MNLEWTFSSFNRLSAEELYAILELRQRVFIVEQRCAYQDCDGRDRKAHHLTGWMGKGEEAELIAYLRLLPPENRQSPVSIGRVVTHPDFRGQGIGKEMMRKCLSKIGERFPESTVRIAAQQYLIRFYEGFGFQISSEAYQEDGIDHIEMTHKEIASRDQMRNTVHSHRRETSLPR